jgi:ribonucleoside-diphosphate reductase alpha chain
MQQYIHVSKYARWIEEENRRETWEETVDRYINHVVIPGLLKGTENVPDLDYPFVEDLSSEIRQAILAQEIMPSMRAMMTAGPALERDHMAGYNCAFVAVDHPRAFDEALYVLTCGTGVGFSCESKYISKLPEVAETFHDTDTTIVVADSRIGWASSFRELIQLLYGGKVPRIDVSKVRPKGSKLKTFGGRASGPAPLVDLFNYTVGVFKGAAGRKLNDLEVHGIMCKIGEIVVVGGVRRSAEISLSDLSSDRMATAKSGQWWVEHPEYALANNSAVYDEKPTTGAFMKEWKSLYESRSGERGIYNRQGIKSKTDRIGRRDSTLIAGTNPCGEIALRSAGLCNLTEIVVRSDDNISSLKRKARLATILGTIQSSYTDFRYVRNIWKRNAEEERLLGVSLTGIYDNALLSGLHVQREDEYLHTTLQELKEYCGEINREYAAKLGINPSVAISTVKPSGTVSQLVNSASGIHPRHSEFYIRSVRQDNKDPLTQFMKEAGIPHEPDVTKPDATTVFFFPVRAPEGAVTRDHVDPVSHLELWKVYNEHWAEHQVSITVSVKEDEWVRTGAWVFDNFDELSGISFLPYDGGTYRQAPFAACTEREYMALLDRMPSEVDWSRLTDFEVEDTTTSSHELACIGGQCEITW